MRLIADIAAKHSHLVRSNSGSVGHNVLVAWSGIRTMCPEPYQRRNPSQSPWGRVNLSMGWDAGTSAMYVVVHEGS